MAPVILAIFSEHLKQATGSPKPFGGIPILLVGDFSQLPPVHCSMSIAHGIVKLKEYDTKHQAQIAKLNRQEQWQLHENESSHQPLPKCHRLSEYPEKGKYSERSLFCIGCQLVRVCCWLHLTEQHCTADDPSHMELVLKVAAHQQVSVDDLRECYDILSLEDFDTIDSPWLDATI